MTLRELSQLYWLRREIEIDRMRLAELERPRFGGGRPDGMPRGAGSTDPTAGQALDAAAVREAIEEKTRRCMAERERLERYIAGIPDSLTRQIFTLRFVDGLTWRGVASCVGGGNTAESVRKACRRYLDAEKNGRG